MCLFDSLKLVSGHGHPPASLYWCAVEIQDLSCMNVAHHELIIIVTIIIIVIDKMVILVTIIICVLQGRVCHHCCTAA